MSKLPAPDRPRSAPVPDAAALPDDPTPLTPANVGHAIGDDADPELDVAPNLGGESPQQDA